MSKGYLAKPEQRNQSICISGFYKDIVDRLNHGVMCEHSDVTFVAIYAFSSVKFQNVRKYACVKDLTNLMSVNTKQSLNCHLDSCKWDWPGVTI